MAEPEPEGMSDKEIMEQVTEITIKLRAGALKRPDALRKVVELTGLQPAYAEALMKAIRGGKKGTTESMRGYKKPHGYFKAQREAKKK